MNAGARSLARAGPDGHDTAVELRLIQDRVQAALTPYLLRERRINALPEGARLEHAAVRLTPTPISPNTR